MKPAQSKAERERLAKIKMRRWVRQIPDNAALMNLLLQMEKPFRADFLRVATPFLKFKPISLEVVNG